MMLLSILLLVIVLPVVAWAVATKAHDRGFEAGVQEFSGKLRAAEAERDAIIQAKQRMFQRETEAGKRLLQLRQAVTRAVVQLHEANTTAPNYISQRMANYKAQISSTAAQLSEAAQIEVSEEPKEANCDA